MSVSECRTEGGSRPTSWHLRLSLRAPVKHLNKHTTGSPCSFWEVSFAVLSCSHLKGPTRPAPSSSQVQTAPPGSAPAGGCSGSNTQDVIANFPYLDFREKQKLSYLISLEKTKCHITCKVYKQETGRIYTFCFLLTLLERSLEHFK